MKQKLKKAIEGPRSAKPVDIAVAKTNKIDPALAAAIARGKIARKKMSLAEGGSISAAKAARLLGISVPKLIYRWRHHRLIGWPRGKAVRFPAWQFRDGKSLPGIEEVLQILRSHDAWRILLYFLGNRRSLANERPLDLLRRGESEKVIRHATDYAQANEW